MNLATSRQRTHRIQNNVQVHPGRARCGLFPPQRHMAAHLRRSVTRHQSHWLRHCNLITHQLSLPDLDRTPCPLTPTAEKEMTMEYELHMIGINDPSLASVQKQWLDISIDPTRCPFCRDLAGEHGSEITTIDSTFDPSVGFTAPALSSATPSQPPPQRRESARAN
jgi:hypothetical protein